METQTLNLFIVDDNQSMVVALKHYIQNKFGKGIKISTFYDGESCIKEVDKDTDLVILDYFLDGKNGLDVLKEIKEINLERVKWQAFLGFEVYGVKIGIRSNNFKLIENLEKNLPHLFPVKRKSIDFEAAEHIFSFYISKRNKSKNLAYQADTKIYGSSFSEK